MHFKEIITQDVEIDLNDYVDQIMESLSIDGIDDFIQLLESIDLNFSTDDWHYLKNHCDQQIQQLQTNIISIRFYREIEKLKNEIETIRYKYETGEKETTD